MASTPIAGRGNESGRFAQAATFQDTVRCCEVARANRRTLLAAAIAGRPCQLREAEFGTSGLGSTGRCPCPETDRECRITTARVPDQDFTVRSGARQRF